MSKSLLDIQFSEKLVIAISSRALFDLDDSHKIYVEQGVDAYSKHQITHEDEPLDPGAAYHLVKKLLALNSFYYPETVPIQV